MTVGLLWSVVARPRVPWAVLVLSVLAVGCWSSAPAQTVQPRDGRAGLQLTGTVDGSQLAVSDGAPRLVVGDCDPDATGDSDVCVIADDINGQLVVLAIENPAVLESQASLPVVDPGCGQRCDDVTDGAVVDLQLGIGDRVRATGGRIELDTVEPFIRYAGEVRLEFPSGRVSGSLDVVPRRD